MARFRISKELSVAVLVSVGLHALWLAREAKASSMRTNEVSEVSLETIAPKSPLPEMKPEEPPTPTSTKPETALRQPSTKTLTSGSKSLPSAAQAAKTLTAPESAGPADLADFTLVQGEGTNYAGGTTSAIGTSRAAVRGPASDAVNAIPRAAAAGVARAPALDRSRSATPAVPAWDCSRLFPSDADAGDYATVLIAVSVGADGSAKHVAMLRDPGHGFGAAAIRCAMGQRYNSALDVLGNPAAATTPPILVRFSR